MPKWATLLYAIFGSFLGDLLPSWLDEQVEQKSYKRHATSTHRSLNQIFYLKIFKKKKKDTETIALLNANEKVYKEQLLFSVTFYGTFITFNTVIIGIFFIGPLGTTSLYNALSFCFMFHISSYNIFVAVVVVVVSLLACFFFFFFYWYFMI